jgi:hypothetical protein
MHLYNILEKVKKKVQNRRLMNYCPELGLGEVINPKIKKFQTNKQQKIGLKFQF